MKMEPQAENFEVAESSTDQVLNITSLVRWNGQLSEPETVEVSSIDTIEDVRSLVLEQMGYSDIIDEEAREGMVVILVYGTSTQNLTQDVNVVSEATHFGSLTGSAFIYVSTAEEQENVPQTVTVEALNVNPKEMPQTPVALGVMNVNPKEIKSGGNGGNDASKEN